MSTKSRINSKIQDINDLRRELEKLKSNMSLHDEKVYFMKKKSYFFLFLSP